MLASITPLGERGRGNRWWLTTAAYELGSAAGGAAMGAAAGGIGEVVRLAVLPSAPGRAGLALAVTLVALAVDLGRPGRLPTWNRQVDKAWLDRYRGWVYGAGFGVQLGTGLVTIVNSAAMYALVGLILLLGSPLLGAIAGTVFGVARAAPLLAFGRARDFAAMQATHRRLDRLAASSRLGTLAVLSMAALVLAVSASLR